MTTTSTEPATARSFDGTESARATVIEPADARQLEAVFDAHHRVAIRGSGLSYCLAGAADDLPTVSTRRLDRVLHVDPARRTIRVQAGVTIGALLRAAVEHGCWFPVTPGHPHITVGGCVAFNTHGKAQHGVGQLSDHVESLTLWHPDHGQVTCGPDDRPQLFELTLGGMGLTGFVLDVTLRLQPLAGAAITRRTHPVDDLVHAVDTMEALDAPGAQLYSWHDGNRRGPGFGRGVVYEEHLTDHPVAARTRYRRLDPARRGAAVPVPLWNRATTAAVNRVHGTLEARRGPRTAHVLDAAFPINGKELYFHAFGRRGLREYQLIVPRAAWPEAVARTGGLIAATGACITLASLKLFRGRPRLLWFTGDGVCLALDAPATTATDRLFAGLDRLAADLGAPVNLAKDSRIDAATVARIFPGYDELRERLAAHDPARRIDSALRRRIGV